MSLPRKCTKILCTLGPATDHPHVLDRMIQAGMDVARLNMSHGDHLAHGRRLRLLRAAAERVGKPIGVLADLQGPKLRVGDLGGGIDLSRGQMVRLGGGKPSGQAIWIPTPFRRLGAEVRRGDSILLVDGAIELRVQAVQAGAVVARVVTGGHLGSHQGINLPGRALSIPAFTPKDQIDLEFALKQNVDFVAMSFVRSAADVQRVRRAMKRAGAARPIIAKIEKPQALADIDNIIDSADGIMVARGDLGVELSVEKVPAAQKMIIQKCARAEKWVIVATQMLESMIEHPSPTRAEASDVANAVYDGADCVMLSAETSVGRYPDLTVKMMAKICAAAECSASFGLGYRRLRREDRPPNGQVGHAVIDAALLLLAESAATAFWVFTRSGRTALRVSKQRPAKPVYAFTPHRETLRYLSGLWGVTPLYIPLVRTTDQMIATAQHVIRSQGLAKPGQDVILLVGHAVATGATHIIKVHRVG